MRFEVSFSTEETGVVLAGPDRRVRQVNRVFTAITGYTQKEMAGLTCAVLQGPLTHPAAVQAMQRALADNREFSGVVCNYRRDGSTFWNHLTISPVRDDVRRLSHYVGIIRQVSEPPGNAVRSRCDQFRSSFTGAMVGSPVQPLARFRDVTTEWDWLAA